MDIALFGERGANILWLCSVLPQSDGFCDIWRGLSTSSHVWRRSRSQRLLVRSQSRHLYLYRSAQKRLNCGAAPGDGESILCWPAATQRLENQSSNLGRLARGTGLSGEGSTTIGGGRDGIGGRAAAVVGGRRGAAVAGIGGRLDVAPMSASKFRSVKDRSGACSGTVSIRAGRVAPLYGRAMPSVPLLAAVGLLELEAAPGRGRSLKATGGGL